MTGPVGSLPTVSVSVARTTLNVAIFLAMLVAMRTTVIAGQYRELFDAKNRCDPPCLNRRGGEIYTNLLAERFAEHLRNG